MIAWTAQLTVADRDGQTYTSIASFIGGIEMGYT